MRKAGKKCGAKTRSGLPCQSYAVLGGNRCRMHGGKGSGAKKGNLNAFSLGLYSDAILPEEQDIAPQIELGTVDKELRIARLRLRRVLQAELTEEEFKLVSRVEQPAILGGIPVYEELIKTETFQNKDFGPIVDRLMSRIESLERTRVDLIKHAAADDGDIQPVKVEIKVQDARVTRPDAEPAAS